MGKAEEDLDRIAARLQRSIMDATDTSIPKDVLKFIVKQKRKGR